MTGAAGGPDYKNLHYNADGSLYMEPDEGASFNDQIKVLGSAVSGGLPHSYENMGALRAGGQQDGEDGDDYMNDFPEGLDHIYSNQDDLLLQVRETVCCIQGTR